MLLNLVRITTEVTRKYLKGLPSEILLPPTFYHLKILYAFDSGKLNGYTRIVNYLLYHVYLNGLYIIVYINQN